MIRKVSAAWLSQVPPCQDFKLKQLTKILINNHRMGRKEEGREERRNEENMLDNATCSSFMGS